MMRMTMMTTMTMTIVMADSDHAGDMAVVVFL